MKDENCNIHMIPNGHSIKQKMSSPQKKTKKKREKKNDFPGHLLKGQQY